MHKVYTNLSTFISLICNNEKKVMYFLISLMMMKQEGVMKMKLLFNVQNRPETR